MREKSRFAHVRISTLRSLRGFRSLAYVSRPILFVGGLPTWLSATDVSVEHWWVLISFK